MAIVTGGGVGKRYGAHECFSGISFEINPGARIGLIGANGCGKTTLLKIILGEDQDYEGSVARQKGLRCAYLSQDPVFGPDETVRGAVIASAGPIFAIEKEMEEVHHAFGEKDADTDKLLRRLDELQQKYETANGYDLDRRADTILAGVGIPESRFNDPISVLSGGERNRVALARLLLVEPDIWLMDEPTNHLDFDAIQYLERFLASCQAATIIVSHDRRFLDMATTSTWEMEQKRLYLYSAPYSRAKELREERLLSEERAYEKQKEYIAKQEEFIRRFGAGQRAKEAKGREKQLSRVARLERPANQARLMALNLPTPPRLGDKVLRVKELGLSFGDRELFSKIAFEMEAGETIGIVGPNGTGKTSLLKILLGQLKPTQGECDWGSTAKLATLAQHEAFPNLEATPLSFIRSVTNGWTEQEMRSLLGAMLFSGTAMDKPVAGLSGGERKRLMLTKLLFEEANILLFDEPTNHLDIGSREALELALSAYEGCLIVISHDRYFLDQVADRVLWMEDGEWRITLGGFEEAFVAHEKHLKQKEAAGNKPAPRIVKQAEPAPQPPAKPKPQGKKKSRFAKLTTEEIEDRIIKAEAEKKRINESFAGSEVYKDAEKVQKLQAQIAKLGEELEDLDEEYLSR